MALGGSNEDSGVFVDSGVNIKDASQDICVAPQAEYVFELSTSGLAPSTQEFILWHATRPGIVGKIESIGFDPHCGGSLVEKMFWVGNYLAENASKSKTTT